MTDIHFPSRKGPPKRSGWYWPKPATKAYRDGWDAIFLQEKLDAAKRVLIRLQNSDVTHADPNEYHARIVRAEREVRRLEKELKG
jgi:hypothetical protein|tara:strand:+ start:1788 stop:2042 length:255 start_codon:yes stop_codon:yes gene_type:complete